MAGGVALEAKHAAQSPEAIGYKLREGQLKVPDGLEGLNDPPEVRPQLLRRLQAGEGFQASREAV